jgi:hypothetical protein
MGDSDDADARSVYAIDERKWKAQQRDTPMSFVDFHTYRRDLDKSRDQAFDFCGKFETEPR